MFESLDPAVLGALARIEDGAVLKSETTLEKVTCCLDQAIKDCEAIVRSGTPSSLDYKQAALGIMAAQRIINRRWAMDSTPP